jgi:hypothetical protein
MADREIDAYFKVRGNWSDRAVACRVAMALGVSGPLAWEEGDEGYPHWRPEAGNEGKWDVCGNDYWLRKIDEGEPDEVSKESLLKHPVKTFKLSGRYLIPMSWDWDKGDPPRLAALKALAQYLESDLVFGK